MKRAFAIASAIGVLGLATWFACGGDDGGSPGGGDDGGGGDGQGSGSGSGSGGSVGPDGAPLGDDGGPKGDGSFPPPPPDGSTPPPFDAGASVLQHHNHANRDGIYVDPAFTKAAAPKLTLASTWNVSGPVYAQPLFVDGAIGGKDAILVATEQNVVYAFDAASTNTLWKTPVLAKPLPQGTPGCGNIGPIGITGTPYVDLPSRTIYLDAMTNPSGQTAKHLVYALSLDDGSVRAGWPVDLDAALAKAPIPFTSISQNQRGALALLNGVLYVPFGGHYGDCGSYHGWIVGVDVASRAVKGWATPGASGGSWAVAGVASDGTSLYITTGNTAGAGEDAAAWVGGDAVVRFGAAPTFSGASKDFFAPGNWPTLDDNDIDLGGTAAVPLDVPGATPSAMMLALGKDGNAYLLDRANLGGVGGQVAVQSVAGAEISGASVVYRTSKGTFAAFHLNTSGTGTSCPNGGAGDLVAVSFGAAKPPTIAGAWCSDSSDLAVPIVTMSSAAGTDAIVWAPTQGGELHGYDGETGTSLFSGTGMTSVQHFQTAIVAKGRLYVAADAHLYAWKP
jgi:hypothetical protein